jgi:starch phosphorylase
MFPGRFNNKTNGITPRRWLKACNPGLSALITDYIGEGWIRDLSEIKALEKYVNEPQLIDRWKKAKHDNKKRLAWYVKDTMNEDIDPDTLFETQIKRIHEYKRQTLSILYAISLYNRLRKNPGSIGTPRTPRTIMFSGKAAPGYAMAKLIVKLINSIAGTINADPLVHGKLKVLFLPNYSVTLAEKIIPASDLSVQISTAGMEASGTGNMKLSLNGALTVGTLDGANIEIMEEVGKENIFIFGLNANEVMEKKQSGYRPREVYNQNTELREVLDMIHQGYFCVQQRNLFHPIVESLLNEGDHYMVLEDFQSYCDIQDKIGDAYLDADSWAKTSILNVSRMGKFSSDRSIKEYAEEIWNVPVNPKHS